MTVDNIVPEVSVLMPVHNGAKYLAEAIKSILRQNFIDFELLIIDDGSTDEIEKVIGQFSDSRIVFVRNSENVGVASTLNRGIDLARGRFIARMDSDDISMPYRLQKQVEFLGQHPQVAVVGSWVEIFGSNGTWKEHRPCKPEVVKASLIFDTPFFHPSVMLRKEILQQHCLRYDPSFSCSEDYELWTRVVRHGDLDNIPEVLVRMRHHEESVTHSKQETMRQQTLVILSRELALLQIVPDMEALAFHHNISRGHRMVTQDLIVNAEAWLSFLLRKNNELGVFEAAAMSETVGIVWFRLCRNCGNLGLWIWRRCRYSPLFSGYTPSRVEWARFIASIAWNALLSKTGRKV